MSIAKKSQTEPSLDVQASEAFRKASHDVIKRAEQAGAEIVVWRDNAVVKLSPAEAATLLKAEDSSVTQ